MANNIGTLGEYDQRRLWKCVYIYDLIRWLNKNKQIRTDLSIQKMPIKQQLHCPAELLSTYS